MIIVANFETAVLHLHNDIVSGLDIGLCSVLASLDLSAAFDTVNHNIFITRLNTEFQISGTIIQWFKSYLDARHHNVCINDDYLRSHTSSCGVPQGSVLGARMFTMYMRPLSAIMDKHGVSYHSYAGDIQLYLKCGSNDISVDNAISRLEMCIKDICKWMSQNALKLIEDKTDFIIFSPKQNQFTTKVINVGANKIPSSEFIKILGITMDRVLSIEKDISNTCRGANMQIRKINSIRHYLTESSSKTLITSTVLTRLDYCNSVYIGLPQKSLHRLQLTQNSAARTI